MRYFKLKNGVIRAVGESGDIDGDQSYLIKPDWAEITEKEMLEICNPPLTPGQSAKEARTQRDQLLSATDWLIIRATETGEPVPAEWVAYRQALRDVPQQSGFPENIDWPVHPEDASILNATTPDELKAARPAALEV